MATKAPNEDNGGEGQTPCNTETSDDWGDDEVILLAESNISSESRLHKQRQEKSKPHVIMINKSCCQTVVSSGGSGHVQHVSVVGHVQQLGQQTDGANNILGGETDELPSKKKEKSKKEKQGTVSGRDLFLKDPTMLARHVEEDDGEDFDLTREQEDDDGTKVMNNCHVKRYNYNGFK